MSFKKKLARVLGALKKKIDWVLGALATLSGILLLLEYAGKLKEWLSNRGISLTLDIRPLLYIGIALFPVYLFIFKVVPYIRTKLMKKDEPEYDFSDFDKHFESLQQATEPNTKAIVLREFQPKLHNLCYDCVWNDGKRVRITKVLKYIPKNLSENPHIDFYLHFLGLTIHRDKEHTIPMVKETFLKELENLYDDAKFETNLNILRILQELHEHSEEFMMKLINDAIFRWSDKRFNTLRDNIECWMLKDKNKEAYERVLRYLRRKMDVAEKDKDEKSYERLAFLYSRR